ncbi:hypothetical protein N792_07075 [Lysobacter concretionis Ko07 = DSM 16239]|uniref:Uncharacterized protein n=1 Tax=Lysobacter concretionis Ko07 = DSM 16239 TaxID=1122185 RepID=A0A0A0ENT7_9GAMM|nr:MULTISPECIES: hypothetical protein [Lysobacter]KGM52094.1 hypothetical protein N792_07075 [Lysobacter concretionis Ko07 = DSM 16239]QOD90170.1 hypothetical protein H2514_07910 [Lysobacter sp. CW239]
MSGLPKWTHIAQDFADFSECDDPEQVTFDTWGDAEFGFQVAAFDVWLTGLYECSARDELLRHRAQAFAAFRANERETAGLLFQLMRARQKMVQAKPLAMAGQKQKHGGRKGAKASKQARRGPESKRAAILAALSAYAGPDSAKVATVARKTGATPRYVRRVQGENKEP